MHDVLPDASPAWQYVESRTRTLIRGYGYEEIRLPLLEQTELFARSAGETSDIVEKQMYSFTDQDGSRLSLRPEGTAGCVRAYIQNGLFKRGPQRLWYGGSMFRHEKPQKGRYRQFDQIGVEAFGIADAALDVELMVLMADVFERLGVASEVRLELNSIGDAEDRARYRAALVEYLSRYARDLDADSAARLERNPLRVLDSKDPNTQRIVEGAPRLSAYLGDEARQHFEKVCELLEAQGVGYHLNETLVRGLDYYNRTVFEWTTQRLGSQGTVCAGGRYDGLVAELGGPATPAAGFAMGIDRVVLLVEAAGIEPDQGGVDAYLVCQDERALARSMRICRDLRMELPDAAIRMNLGGGSLKAQFRRADQSGARIALIVGERELAEGNIGIKFLREEREQMQVPLDQAAGVLRAHLASTT